MHPPTCSHSAFRPGLWSLLAAVLRPLAPLPAQTATVAPTRTEGAVEGEAIALEVFTVSSTKDRGYAADDSATAGRYAQKIKEVPFPVTTITSDFLEDFLAFDTAGQDLLNYVSGSYYAAGTGAINLRGIRGFSKYKNGVREGGVYGPASVDRQDVVKGAAASMYGQAEPSGMVNLITKTPTPKAFQEFKFTGGSQSYEREMFDVSQPLNPRLATRFSGSHEYNEQTRQTGIFRRTNFYNGTTYQAGDNTKFVLTAERVRLWSSIQNNNYIFANTNVGTSFVDPVTGKTINIGSQAIGLLGWGPFERYAHVPTTLPSAYNLVAYTQIGLQMQHRFNRWLTSNVFVDHWQRNQDQVTTNTSGLNYNADTDTLAGTFTAPNVVRNRADQWDARADLLAKGRFWGLEHSALLSADYTWNFNNSGTRSSSNPAFNVPAQNYLKGGPYFAPGLDYAWSWDPAVYNQLKANTRSNFDVKGISLGDNVRLFGDRLILSGRVRRDVQGYTKTDFVSAQTLYTRVVPVGERAKYPTQSSTTYSWGGVFVLTKDFNVYVSKSTAFLPQSTTATQLDVDGNTFEPQRGDSKEVGVKGSLLDNQLQFTLAYYDIFRTNILRQVKDPINGSNLVSPVTGQGYYDIADVRSRGVELDSSLRVASAWTVGANAAVNNIRYVRIPNPTESYLLGMRPDANPRLSGGAYVLYTFGRGTWFEGWRLRFAGRYRGPALMNTGTSSIYGNSGVRGVDKLYFSDAAKTKVSLVVPTYFFSTPGFWYYEGGLSYSFATRRWADARHTVSLDVKNLLNQRFLNGTAPTTPFQLYLSYRIRL